MNTIMAIDNIEDLKNRTLVESNTLKSFILAQSDKTRAPQRDDILIHDYQIANSVTINSILSNYVVDLIHALSQYNSNGEETTESYFKIVENIEQKNDNLPNETRLVLSVENDSTGQYAGGTFLSRKLDFNLTATSYKTEGTTRFVNLDSIWYGIVAVKDENGNDDYDTIEYVPELNPSRRVLYGEGENPFVSFNDRMKETHGKLNQIVENRFYGNSLDVDEESLGNYITSSKYIVCLKNRLWGLKPKFDSVTNEFTGFEELNIGSMMKNLDQEVYANGGFDFVNCGFHVVNNDITLFVVFKEKEGT